jgi:hypothetical protein
MLYSHEKSPFCFLLFALHVLIAHHGNPLQCPDFFSETHFMCCDFFGKRARSPGRRPSSTKVACGLFGLSLSLFGPENESSAFAFFFKAAVEFRERDKMKKVDRRRCIMLSNLQRMRADNRAALISIKFPTIAPLPSSFSAHSTIIYTRAPVKRSFARLHGWELLHVHNT